MTLSALPWLFGWQSYKCGLHSSNPSSNGGGALKKVLKMQVKWSYQNIYGFYSCYNALCPQCACINSLLSVLDCGCVVTSCFKFLLPQFPHIDGPLQTIFPKLLLSECFIGASGKETNAQCSLKVCMAMTWFHSDNAYFFKHIFGIIHHLDQTLNQETTWTWTSQTGSYKSFMFINLVASGISL